MSRKQVIPRTRPPADGDDTGCHILHVDMDAFFAGVELLKRPELRGRPVVVGGLSPRSVVLSATYEAREFGVHSAMPMARARRLCPHAVIVPPSGGYGEISRRVMSVFRDVTPDVEPLSLDEAFLDVRGAIRRLGSPRRIAELIRAQVRGAHGVTCSVGVASTKFVAKLASREAKPDGLVVVPADRVVEFLHPLPVAALWGVGERTESALLRLGIQTIGDLAQIPRGSLEREFGTGLGAHLSTLAWGRDERSVVARVPEKSIGNEETFRGDVDDPAIVKRELLRLSEKVAARLRAAGYVGRTVSVKLRRADFTTITRSRTLREATDVAKEIYATAVSLYLAAGLERVRLRLVGVRMENLRPAETSARQMSLGEREKGWREAERAMDRAVGRFGSGAVRPATLVDHPEGTN